MFVRELGNGGSELVAMVPALRHHNRVSAAERAHERAVRTLQRLRHEDWRWASAMSDPSTLPAALRRMSARCARRSRVMYARIARTIGGAR